MCANCMGIAFDTNGQHCSGGVLESGSQGGILVRQGVHWFCFSCQEQVLLTMEPSYPHNETAQPYHEMVSESCSSCQEHFLPATEPSYPHDESAQPNHEVASESSGDITSEDHSSHSEGVGHREGRRRHRYMELFGDDYVPSQAWELLVCRLDALFVQGVRSIRTCQGCPIVCIILWSTRLLGVVYRCTRHALLWFSSPRTMERWLVMQAR